MEVVFYHLDTCDRDCVEGNETNDWEAIVCPVTPEHKGPGRRITELRLDLIRSKIVDFSWTMVADIAITDRALHVIREAGLTGYRVEPAVLIEVPKRFDRNKIARFWELIVTGTAGHAHPDSGIRLKRKCDACDYVRYSAYENGIIVDEAQWDGTDFFTVVEYPALVLVTQRVKDVFEKYKISNVEFIPSREMRWPECLPKDL